MHIQIEDKQYSCTGYNPTINSVIFSGVEGLTVPITGTVILCDNDGLELAVQDCSKFARQTYDNGLLMLTNEPKPAAPTIAELQAAAFERISGKCSEAIYSGVTVNGKHYSLTATAQGNLKSAQDKAKAGEAAIPYNADGEELTSYTAAQILAIAKTADEWGTVNIAYYGKLKKWISREADKTVIAGIHYGSALPNDLMTELATTLAGFGINVSDYAAMLTT